MDEREISEAEQRNAIITTITLDISNKHLRDVPKSIKNFANIEFLYLSNNEIKCVPDFFFSSLPQLKWLDFRHNLLSSLPQSIGNHKELRTLLLQGNNITRLPIELGNVPTITGLNIAGNPLEYPPQNVLQEGTSSILKFLRQQLLENSLLLPELVDEMGDLELGDNEGYIGRRNANHPPPSPPLRISPSPHVSRSPPVPCLPSPTRLPRRARSQAEMGRRRTSSPDYRNSLADISPHRNDSSGRLFEFVPMMKPKRRGVRNNVNERLSGVRYGGSPPPKSPELCVAPRSHTTFITSRSFSRENRQTGPLQKFNNAWPDNHSIRRSM